MLTQFFTFDPPYESPLEEDLAWHLTKHLADDVELPKQEEVVTPFGTFELDLVAKPPSGSLIAFECDGQGYHPDPFRDRCRDALILGMGVQAAIYRFRGPDLWYHMYDCLYIVTQKDPGLFSWRGHRNIELLASDEVKSALGSSIDSENPSGYEHRNTVTVYYPEFSLVVERRTLDSWLLDAGVTNFLSFALDGENTTFSNVYYRYLRHLKKRA